MQCGTIDQTAPLHRLSHPVRSDPVRCAYHGDGGIDTHGRFHRRIEIDQRNTCPCPVPRLFDVILMPRQQVAKHVGADEICRAENVRRVQRHLPGLRASGYGVGIAGGLFVQQPQPRLGKCPVAGKSGSSQNGFQCLGVVAVGMVGEMGAAVIRPFRVGLMIPAQPLFVKLRQSLFRSVHHARHIVFDTAEKQNGRRPFHMRYTRLIVIRRIQM